MNGAYSYARIDKRKRATIGIKSKRGQMLPWKKSYVSKHFSKKEWECQRCCGQLYKHKRLIKMAEKFRKYLNEKYNKKVTIMVHCVNRCKEKNDSVAGSVHSYHLRGMAIDCHSPDLTPKEFIDSALECHKEDGILNGGIGVYDNWFNPGVHFDIGPYRRFK